ncbi:MAG: glycosyl hydrolase [Myxococcales bacterium]|nr:MAG: glycosyl hydrolase [Myxococcales bacterium]
MTRLLAFYLPQYHPIPENDAWWGAGFTEWNNVAKAKPLFPGHYQPHLPGELGFYDLRLPETRKAQAELARSHGIHGFIYYHYWFEGRLLLERPLREVLESRQPDLPFCICWANHNWSRTWTGSTEELLLEQRYSLEDDREHIRWLLPYLKDPRYITVAGKPVVFFYRAQHIHHLPETVRLWQQEAKSAGLPGLYLSWVEGNHPSETPDLTGQGFDAACEFQPRTGTAGPPLPTWLRGRLRTLAPAAFRRHHVRDYARLVEGALAREAAPYKRFPCVTPAWDNSARRAPSRSANVWIGSTPALYERWLRTTLERFTPFGPDEDFVIVNAWNEWAEGNHLEPDRKWGRAYLEATRRALDASQRGC